MSVPFDLTAVTLLDMLTALNRYTTIIIYISLHMKYLFCIPSIVDTVTPFNTP